MDGAEDSVSLQTEGNILHNLINNILSENNLESSVHGTGPSVLEGNNNVIINMPSFGDNNGQASQSEGGVFSNCIDTSDFNSTSSSQSIKTTILNYMPSLKWLFVFIDNYLFEYRSYIFVSE